MHSVASWTDAVLAVASGSMGLWLLLRGHASGRTTGLGLLLVAVAALVGALRFGGVEGLAPSHAGLSGLAACVGLPCVGAGWATAAFAPDWAEVVRRYVFGLLLVVAALAWWVAEVRTGLGAVGMIAVVVAAVASAKRAPAAAGLGAAGALLTMLVGLVIGTDGDLMGFPRVGWFHLGLAVGAMGQGLGLAWLPEAPREA